MAPVSAKQLTAKNSKDVTQRVEPAIPYALTNNSKKSHGLHTRHKSSPSTTIPAVTDSVETTLSTHSVAAPPAPGQNAEEEAKNLVLLQPTPKDVANNVEKMNGNADAVDSESHREAKVITNSLRKLPPPFYPAHPVSESDSPAFNSAASHRNTHVPAKVGRQGATPSAGRLVFGEHRQYGTPSPTSATNNGHDSFPLNHQRSRARPPPIAHSNHSYHMSEPINGRTYNTGNGSSKQENPYHMHARDSNHFVPPHFGQSRQYYPANSRAPLPNRHLEDLPSQFHPRFPDNRSPAGINQSSMLGAMDYRFEFPNTGPVEQAQLQNLDVDTYTHPSHGMSPHVPPQSAISDHSAGAPNGFIATTNNARQYSSFVGRGNPAILSHIRNQFGSSEFSDCAIHLSHKDSLLSTRTIYLHSLLLVGSPKFHSLIAVQYTLPSSGQHVVPRNLQIQISDKYLNHDVAMTKALLYLYGDTLPDAAFVSNIPRNDPDNLSAGKRSEMMRFALAFAAAGHFMELNDIISCGLDLAITFLDWENVHFALAFALDGGLSSNWSQYDVAFDTPNSSSTLNGTPTVPDSSASTPTYGFYSERLLAHIIHFMAHNCPENLVFSKSASQRGETPQLPSSNGARTSRSASRLSQIRFGQLNNDNQSNSEKVALSVSSLLVSLPFALLKHILHHPVLAQRLGRIATGKLTYDVVEEREIQRKLASGHREPDEMNSSGEDERTLHDIQWVETVELAEKMPSGVTLNRRWLNEEASTSMSQQSPVDA